MATKDWKKISNDISDLQWINKNNYIISVFAGLTGKWYFTIRNPNYTIKKEIEFERRAESMKFAKNYMVKN